MAETEGRDGDGDGDDGIGIREGGDTDSPSSSDGKPRTGSPVGGMSEVSAGDTASPRGIAYLR